MPATVLGKRTRSAAAAASTKPSTEETDRRVTAAVSCTSNASTATRSKRRIAINEPNDENENPFIKHKDAEDEGEEDVETRPTKKTRSSGRTAPAKHGVPESRVEQSPAKVESHFKVSKAAAIGVYQDGKSDQENVEPQTPRHRDQLSKKVPVTPRHRVLIAGSQVTPRTPKTPHTPSIANSVYNQARQLFSRCSNPGRLVGRESERADISSFIKHAVESKTTGCLYVSGPPGTGKSAMLDEVIQEHTKDSQIPVAVVNCMSVRNTKDLSQKLSEDLNIKENAGLEHLRSCFVRGKARDSQKYLVVLDEVDQLVDLDLELLYSLFEWSMHNTSRLILIGIANALDLTDRFLPRLKSRNLKPELLPFMPYSAAQIADVVTSKLKTLNSEDSQNVPFLHPAAIQFCAKKVAAQTGDLRKAFDICKRAIDLVDRETRERDAKAILENSPSKTPLMENINLSSPAKSPAKDQPKYTVETAPKATIAHMARVTALAFSNGATQRLGGLNLQQKAVLCALAALERRKRETQVEKTMFATPSKTNNSSAPSVKQLFEAYSGLCKHENLFHALSSLEFRDVVSGLETLSLVSGVDGKNGSFAVPITPSRTPGRKPKGAFGGAAIGDERRIASAVSVKELSGALEGPGGDLLKEMLEGNGL
ncbi:Cell division control protein 18 [Fulvia fulva]|uniref:Cell division control protein n=1 Tax=Passalora fulva TaxID=5499 RepID=A0A9Q8PIA5_PASFU|nr:Cell division control protein 18 [Fulvia fulva]KAK4615693.1 Cell division control protein 18 [Fulvia fulva]KAK4617408.1 Cell division control protein 18 [Fulvia fulva]UJO22968.1 Cell division control protein 18 [Fulvia fulva]WPV18885.1 Cell division control protein 18 [Fulvia fulva]WPV34594.1 Cell division control protein 18 [Fulvia fulva]